MSDDWTCPECEYSGDRKEVLGHVRGRTDDAHDDVEPERADSDAEGDEPEDGEDTEAPDEGAPEDPSEGDTDPQDQVIDAAVSGEDVTDEPEDDDGTEGSREGPSPPAGLPWKRVALGLVALGAAVVVSGSREDDTIDVEGTVESTEPADPADSDSDGSDASEPVARGLS